MTDKEIPIVFDNMYNDPVGRLIVDERLEKLLKDNMTLVATPILMKGDNKVIAVVGLSLGNVPEGVEF